jgi:hypothetical protein
MVNLTSIFVRCHIKVAYMEISAYYIIQTIDYSAVRERNRHGKPLEFTQIVSHAKVDQFHMPRHHHSQ